LLFLTTLRTISMFKLTCEDTFALLVDCIVNTCTWNTLVSKVVTPLI